MAAVGEEEDAAVQAAKILLTLRNRRLRRWPEWVPKDPEKDQAAGEGGVSFTLDEWPRQQRSGNRLRAGSWPSVHLAVSTSISASAPTEKLERSPRWTERSAGRDELTVRRPDSPFYYRAPAGSGPSTSAADAGHKARPRRPIVEMVVGKAPLSPAPPVAVAPTKERPMKAPSPETPLDFGAGGSGASSSGEDATGSTTPSKRKAPGALGSAGGGACSSDEGCSSPDKRARVDANDDGAGKAISAQQQQTPGTEKKGVKFEFDLNMPCPEDDYGSPGFC